MKKVISQLIRFYQKTKPFHIEPLTRLFLTDNACRYSPTCSEYTYEAVQKYGALKGVWMGIKRIVRCNPWSKGGFDPVR